VCNHCADDCDGECNYTPKKRHKVPGEHGHIGRQIAPYGNRSASFLVSDMAIMDGRSGNGMMALLVSMGKTLARLGDRHPRHQVIEKDLRNQK
jgi:hypothetical protein